QIRESKNNKAVAAQWEQFCPRYLGLSRAHADKLIQQLDEFGAAYFELSQIVRIPENAYRAISGAVSGHSIEYKGETIPISRENSRRNRRGRRVAAAPWWLASRPPSSCRPSSARSCGQSASAPMPASRNWRPSAAIRL